jgi:hypothetical protein
VFLTIHNKKYGIKKQDNTIKYIKRKAAWAAFFCLLFFNHV